MSSVQGEAVESRIIHGRPFMQLPWGGTVLGAGDLSLKNGRDKPWLTYSFLQKPEKGIDWLISAGISAVWGKHRVSRELITVAPPPHLSGIGGEDQGGDISTET